MTSKELSQDSKADKSQQLKKETKDQQGRTASKRKSVAFAKKSSVSFSGFARAKTEQFQSNSGSESKKKCNETACTLTTAQRMILNKRPVATE